MSARPSRLTTRSRARPPRTAQQVLNTVGSIQAYLRRVAKLRRVANSPSHPSQQLLCRVIICHNSLKRYIYYKQAAAYLKFLPSAHALPSSSRSQARAASKYFLSSSLVMSSLVYSYDSQSGATLMTGTTSWPRRIRVPVMTESLALPRTPTEPNRYFRDASRRLKKPPI